MFNILFILNRTYINVTVKKDHLLEYINIILNYVICSSSSINVISASSILSGILIFWMERFLVELHSFTMEIGGEVFAAKYLFLLFVFQILPKSILYLHTSTIKPLANRLKFLWSAIMPLCRICCKRLQSHERFCPSYFKR